MKINKRLFNVLLALALTASLNAQLSNIGSFVAAGTEDAEKLFQAYFEPFGNSLGANLSAGWYSTAKSHNLLGFDLTATISTAFVPDAARSFDLSEVLTGSPGTNITRSFSDNIAPTVSGDKNAPTISYLYNYNGNNYPFASVKAPKGLNVGFVPSPMFKFGLGLIKNTEIMGRYVPNLKLGKFGEFGLWGIGLKHELKQYIPVISKVPIFNMSVMGGYTKLNLGAGMSVVPADLGLTSTLPATTWDNQNMDLTVTNWTGNFLVSADIPVISVYGGVGISSSKTMLKLNGNYPMPSFNAATQTTTANAVEDPIDITIGKKDGAITKPRLNAGFKLKLAIIHINFDYVYANYSIATAGLGISFR